MLLFPNAKINLGLRVLAKRIDGYHEIETVMLPVKHTDMLEFVKNDRPETIVENTGIGVDCPAEENLIYKAWELLHKDFNIPHLKIHLHKIIPHGAGLGGGSSDAAFMLKGLNNYFRLSLSEKKLEYYASLLGSDCPFFIKNKPCLATGRGEILNEISLPENFHIVLLFPGFPVSTRDAYKGIVPNDKGKPIAEIISGNPMSWKETLHNQFEDTVFPLYPELSSMKETLYEKGAFYASMSGSGSAMYGLFWERPEKFLVSSDQLTVISESIVNA